MFESFKKKRPCLKYEILGISLILYITFVEFFQLKGLHNVVSHPELFLIITAIIGLVMAMAMGANDIANNMGPAVGSKALTLGGAIIIAAIFEASGALIAGGDVVDTIKGGIIDNSVITDSKVFLYIMMSTLFGAGIWIILATIFKGPVSATHAIIGGLIGGGLTAFGTSAIHWEVIGKIAASWVVSPIMGGGIAAFIMLSIRRNIMKADSRGDAAKVWVPVYVGIMGGVFSMYLLLKGLKPVLKSNESLANIINPETALFAGFIIGILVYMSLISYYSKQNHIFKNSKNFINKLFNIPLIFAVALLSFAHGSNDVANAIGPLAAVADTLSSGGLGGKNVGIPLWVMMTGAIGLVLGLGIFGSRLIKTVGGEITKLNQTRAFAVALASAVTVIIASSLGLPVSSTQIAIGGVFGIGLTREYIKRRKGKEKTYIEKAIINKIILSWVITLPMAAIIASIFYMLITHTL